ncbi:melanocortin receptor 5-like [Ruditapes philippinarum]|uniref:melanocortin receptor 5-like n=1 Tax=Ruditapes philippinarum TaxID=129788 RepID=UPI00295AA594|nr:melanocortin receptor 5-like [Ruditapes philippinarum]
MTENRPTTTRTSAETVQLANFTYNYNFSTDDYIYEEQGMFDSPFTSIYLIICIIGLLLNIMSIIAIVNIPNGMTPHSKLIISLNISDSLILMAALGHNFLYLTSWVACMSIIKRALRDIGILATLLNLLAMASDHYLAIMNPMNYSRFMKGFRCYCLILLIWITSLIIGCSEIIAGQMTEVKFDLHLSFCMKIFVDDFDTEIIVITLVFMVLTGIVMFYMHIYFVAKNIIARDRMLYHDNMHNYKAIKAMVLIIGTFVIFWTPMAIFKIYTHFHSEDYEHLVFADNFLFLMLLLNSLADPLIYATRLQEVQKGYKALFYRFFPSRRFSANEEDFRNQNNMMFMRRQDTFHTFLTDKSDSSNHDHSYRRISRDEIQV